MNELTDEQISTIARQPWKHSIDFARAVIKAHEAQRQAEQEPSMVVAFDEGAKEPRIVSWDKHPTGTYWLYAAPPPAAQPAREPLTTAQVIPLAHRKAWRYKQSSDLHHSDTYTFNEVTLLAFSRAIEQAHGICP